METTEERKEAIEEVKIEPFPGHDIGIETQVIIRALDGFDLNDKAVSNAVKAIMANHEKAVKDKETRDIFKRIASEEALDGVVKLRRAEIELDIAEFRQKLAQKKFDIALEDLRLKIEEFEGIDEDYDWNLKKLLIIRKNKEREKAAFQTIFEFAKSMAAGTSETPLRAIRKGHLPDRLNQPMNEIRTNIRDFFEDLADFLLETATEGQRRVMGICSCPDIAREVAYDEDEPALLRFLAVIGLISKSI